MADIVRISLGMRRDNFFDAHGQASRLAPGFGCVVGLNASFHAGNDSLSLFSDLVTGISKQGIDLFLHNRIHLNQRWPEAFEAFARQFPGRVDAGSQLRVRG